MSEGSYDARSEIRFHVLGQPVRGAVVVGRTRKPEVVVGTGCNGRFIDVKRRQRASDIGKKVFSLRRGIRFLPCAAQREANRVTEFVSQRSALGRAVRA